jgi:probable HAF family extracellular repeat protein
MPVYTYIPLDDPSATSGTFAQGINNAGQIVGYYGGHGFLYSSGTFTTLDDPLGVSGGRTVAYGINDAGQIVGDYIVLSNAGDPHYEGPYAFLYDGSAYQTLFQGVPNGINNVGQIVGSSFLGLWGFIYNGDSPALLTIPIPGEPHAGYMAYAYGINNAGEVVGYDQNAHGFLYSGGTYTTLDDPLGSYGTRAYGINDLGQIVGSYTDSNNKTHGFIYSGGTYTTLEIPKPATPPLHTASTTAARSSGLTTVPTTATPMAFLSLYRPGPRPLARRPT